MRDSPDVLWNISAAMKRILITCAAAISLCIMTRCIAADDAKKDDKKDAKNPAAIGFADPSKLTEKAPETFKAQFDTTKGKITVEVTRSLAPNGADRFYNLVRSGYFKDIAFFRVIPGFMCQFGINGDPKTAATWRAASITDDPVKSSNARGAITFATATVIERHLGWRKSVLAYMIASYVAASRLHDNVHYLSDVVFGAAVGSIAGRTVVHHAADYWAIAPEQVPGGVAISATRTW